MIDVNLKAGFVKLYRGTRWIDGVKVLVDEEPLDPRYDLMQIAKGGFEWTYEGEGPAQLALAILADHLEDDQQALSLYEAYMHQVISDLDNDWEVTSDEVAVSIATLKSREP